MVGQTMNFKAGLEIHEAVVSDGRPDGGELVIVVQGNFLIPAVNSD